MINGADCSRPELLNTFKKDLYKSQSTEGTQTLLHVVCLQGEHAAEGGGRRADMAGESLSPGEKASLLLCFTPEDGGDDLQEE